MRQAIERAPAKINLCLHVRAARPDGYHELDSLLAFARAADELDLVPGTGLVLEGPFAAALAGEPASSNLAAQAQGLLGALFEAARGAPPPRGGLRLVKRLPVAAGLGGGSADAAAALRLLMRAWRFSPEPEALARLALRLGADVPACLRGEPLRVQGIGEDLAPAPAMPEAGLLLVNPGAALATAAVFAERRRGGEAGGALPPLPERFAGLDHLLAYLAGTRNDLEAAALRLEPRIASAAAALRATGARVVRMTGSGPTVFGLYGDRTEAARAAQRITAAEPSWWVAPTAFL